MDVLVGFRFHPTDQEIIRLLQEKRRDPDFSVQAIVEANIYDFEPFELSGLSPIQSEEKWYSFFCAPNYINVKAKRVNRATKTGYWKLTGEGRKIKAKCSNKVIGRKRILVFYERPSGSKEIKTDWVMHQFSTDDDDALYKKDFVVYRIKKKRDKKLRISTNVEGRRKKKLCISTSDEAQPCHHMAFDNGNFVEENTSSESQLPNHLVSDPSDHLIENSSPESQSQVAENSSPELHLQVADNTSPLSNCSFRSPKYPFEENILQADPHGCGGLGQTSFPALQSPINVGQGSLYSIVSSSDYDVLNSTFSKKWEDNLVNPHQVVQDEYPCEVTGHSTLPADFNLAISSAGISGWDGTELDSEMFSEWVNDMFAYNTLCG